MNSFYKSLLTLMLLLIGVIPSYSQEIERSWNPGRILAICAGANAAIYLVTSGNPRFIKADLNGKILGCGLKCMTVISLVKN